LVVLDRWDVINIIDAKRWLWGFAYEPHLWPTFNTIPISDQWITDICPSGSGRRPEKRMAGEPRRTGGGLQRGSTGFGSMETFASTTRTLGHFYFTENVESMCPLCNVDIFP
jgi:hypothetical protein